MEISFIIDRRTHLDRRHSSEDRAAIISPDSDREQRQCDRRNPINSSNIIPVENEDELMKEVNKLPGIDDLDVYASFNEDAQITSIKVSH